MFAGIVLCLFVFGGVITIADIVFYDGSFVRMNSASTSVLLACFCVECYISLIGAVHNVNRIKTA